MTRREVSASEFKRMTYEKQKKYLQQFIDDIDEEVDKNIENQESDEDYVPQSNPDGDEASDVEDVFTDINNKIEIDTDDNDSSDEDFDDFQGSSSQSDVLVAKDKTIWQRKPFTASRTLKRNLLLEKMGPVRPTKTLSIRDTFKCVFSDVMCDIIIRETQ
uniref:Coiled-coil domain-containing protein 1-like n=1 Tax=Diabrotica virgifera virgifera TaxID=50390 RepID=A0A6P7GDH1_DIAVI